MSSYTISVTLYFSLQYFIRVTDVHTQRCEALFASRKHPPPPPPPPPPPGGRRGGLSSRGNTPPPPPPPPPPECREDCGRNFMWSDCVSLHAAVTISKTRLVVWCGQTPDPYCMLHILKRNGKRHRLVVLCLFRCQGIKGKKCIQKCCYVSRRS